MNQLSAQTRREDDHLVFETTVENEVIRLASLQHTELDLADDTAVTVGVRPEDIRLNNPGRASFQATVSVTEYQGNDNFVHLQVGAHELTAVVPPRSNPVSGETVDVSIPPAAIHLFDRTTGEALRTATTANREHEQVQS